MSEECVDDSGPAALGGVGLDAPFVIALLIEEGAARAAEAVPAALHRLVEAVVVVHTEEVAMGFDSPSLSAQTRLRIDRSRQFDRVGLGELAHGDTILPQEGTLQKLNHPGGDRGPDAGTRVPSRRNRAGI